MQRRLWRVCTFAQAHLSLRPGTEISCAGSNNDLCTVYKNGEFCGEAATATMGLLCNHQCDVSMRQIVGNPEPVKKILLAFLSTFWHPCSKCILMCFKKDRGGCQVWKCPKVPELGQRSTECKFLYIRQILAFLSISYPKL